MNAVLQNLLKLQALEFGEIAAKNVETQVTSLRGQIPPPILGHYDRLRAREKKGVALVRNQVCTGCHMRQPLGKITILMRGEDIQLCDSCGRYLFLEEQAGSAPEQAAAETAKVEAPVVEKASKKTPKTPRKRKTQALAGATS
jgi:predicted  nucleic acid-binding Zn-ribbon protein